MIVNENVDMNEKNLNKSVSIFTVVGLLVTKNH